VRAAARANLDGLDAVTSVQFQPEFFHAQSILLGRSEDRACHI
jgi:hypothetical protein